MRSFRAAARAVVAVLITVPSYVAALAGGLLLAPWPKARSRWQGHVFRSWSHALCLAFGVRVRTQGPAPRPPFVLVSNHVSWVDILALGTRLPCVFVAKAEIDSWPVFGALCRAVNTIFIDRKAKRELHRVLERIETTLAAHQGVVIFPEGTSSAGHEVLPFRSPLLELPAKLGRPVHWAAISYRAPAGAPPVHLSVTWWADMPFGPHLWQLLKLRSVEARVTFGSEPVASHDRKQLAADLHRAISGIFEPMADPEEIRRLLALRETDPAALPPLLRRGRGPQ
jgi:1-acyl-sn-glycerol-3-phosphate acyltransferase